MSVECTQSFIIPRSVSVSWAMVLGSPVSVSWVLSRPQTDLIARNLKLQSLEAEVSEDGE